MNESAFEESEYRGRVDRLRAAMNVVGLDACVCVGPELICYFSGYDGHTHFSQQALVVGTNDDPAFVLRDVDIPPAEDTSWVRDLRPYHFGGARAADVVAAAVRDKAAGARRIGVDLQSYALPGEYAFALLEALEPAATLDASRELNALRLVKSRAEVAYVRKAASYAEAGLEAARRTLRAGITEIALAGAIERAMREAGTDYPAMPTWVASGPRNRGGHRTPTHRVIEKGDTVKVEFAGVERRYHAVTMQTFAVGEPSPGARRIYDACRESLVAGSEAVAAGRAVADSERRTVECLRLKGLDPSDMARFGYGVGLQFPPTWLEPLEIIVESDQVFAAGMSFVLHVGMKDATLKHGALVGGAYLLGDRGLEVLSGGPLELWVA